MNVDIQNLGGLQRRVDLTVPASDVAQEVSQRLARLAQQTTMPGFRRGKVPMKIVAASYGSQVQAEVVREKLGNALSSALDASKLRLAGSPRLEPKSAGQSGDIAFSATFEVYPDIELGDLTKLELERFACEVTEADVDQTVEIVQRQRGHRVAVDREATDGDRVTVDFVGTIDGQEFEGGQAKDFSFNLGEGRMLPEFEQGVRGLRAGAQTRFDLSFPGDYPSEKTRGRTAQFSVTLKRVEALELPPIDSNFARALGIADGDLGRMRAELRGNVEREVATRLRSRTREQVFGALLQAARFELPQTLVDEELQRLKPAVAAAGAPAVELGAEADHRLLEAARRRVGLGLLIGELMTRHGLRARPEQVRKAVEAIAQSYEKPSEVIQWYLGNRERLAEIEAGLAEDNVVNWALAQARVRDVTVPFDELMGGRK